MRLDTHDNNKILLVYLIVKRTVKSWGIFATKNHDGKMCHNLYLVFQVHKIPDVIDSFSAVRPVEFALLKPLFLRISTTSIS